MRPSNNMLRGLALAAVLALLAGCSQYLDRREGVTASAGDAMAANRVTMMVDPWPPASADKDIAFNGERMQAAVSRYRTNRVISPKLDGTSGAYQPQQDSQAPAESAAAKPVGPTITQ